MISPAALSRGSKVRILSTARSISREEIQSAITILQNWDLEVQLSTNLFKIDNQFAGSESQRLADLQAALDDTSCDAIFCARGGYGTVHLIDELNFEGFLKHPKWVVGFSDVTVLHAHIQQNFGVESLHACMPINYPKDAKENRSLQTLKRALFENKLAYAFDAKNPLNKIGSAEAELVGGNLSILYSLTGSKSELFTEGKILFIEDVDEYLYHIDRMMMNLKRCGALSNLAGLVVGGMTSMNDNTVSFGKTAEEIIHNAVKNYDYPLVFDFPSGHLDENHALILGRKTQLKVQDNKIFLNQ